MLSYSPALEKLILLSEILPILVAFLTINIRNFEKKKKKRGNHGSRVSFINVFKCSSSPEVQEHKPQVSAGSFHPDYSNPGIPQRRDFLTNFYILTECLLKKEKKKAS